MSLGGYPGETDIQRGKRRIVVGYFFFGALVRLPISASEFAEGPGIGAIDLTAALASLLLLGALAIKPHRLAGIVHVALFLILVEVLTQTVALGGMVPSDLVILFGLLAVIGALIVLPLRSAFVWFLAYLVTLGLAVVLPERIEPIRVSEDRLPASRSRSSGSSPSSSPPWPTSCANVTGSRRNPTISCSRSCQTRSPRDSSRTGR